MMKRMFLGSVLALGLAGLAAPASAALIDFTVASGGVDGVNTRTCSSSICNTTIWSLGSGELYAVTGTITIDTTNNLLDFDLSATSVVLDADTGQVAVDDGASSLVFTGGSYDAIGLPVTASPGSLGSTVYTIGAVQEASVSFADVEAVGAGPGGALSFTDTRVTGSCLINANGTGSCGLTFGASGTTPFQIPGGAAFGTYDRYVRHTINVGMVPEPATALLVLGGLGLLASRRRAY